MTIRVFSIPVEVKEIDCGMFNYNGLGRSTIINNRIEVRSGLTRDCKNQTIMHELLHYVMDNMGISGVIGDDKAELLASSLSAAMLDIIKNNPEFIEDIGGITV